MDSKVWDYHYWLARSLEGSGNMSAARVEYQRALQLNQDSKEAKLRLAALERSEGRNGNNSREFRIESTPPLRDSLSVEVKVREVDPKAFEASASEVALATAAQDG